jgi:dihydrofolate reductase
MRHVILLVMASLDGFFDGPGESWERIDWHPADEEWHEYSIELLRASDTLLFGRKTYEGFASFWSSPDGELAHLLNTISKVVFSTTWPGSRLVRDLLVVANCGCSARASSNLVLLKYATRPRKAEHGSASASLLEA